MSTTPPLRKELRPFFSQLNLLFWSFLAGMIAVGVATWVLSKGAAARGSEFSSLIYLAPFSGIAILILSQRYYFSKTRGLPPGLKVGERMLHFRSASTLRMVLLDTASVINLIAFGLTANPMFLALAAVVLGLFFVQRPTVERMCTDLGLTREERAMLFEA